MMAEKIRVSRWDPAEHITTPAHVAAYLKAAFDDGDPQVIAAAVGAIARSHGMKQLATKTGLAREALYRSFSETGNPSFATMVMVLKELGLRMEITNAADERATPKRGPARKTTAARKSSKRKAA